MGQILSHGALLTAEQHPEHVFAVLDCNNAFNEAKRSAIVGGVKARPRLQRWVNCYNALLSPMKPVYYRDEFTGRMVRTNYASVTGGQQGDLLGSDGTASPPSSPTSGSTSSFACVRAARRGSGWTTASSTAGRSTCGR